MPPRRSDGPGQCQVSDLLPHRAPCASSHTCRLSAFSSAADRFGAAHGVCVVFPRSVVARNASSISRWRKRRREDHRLIDLAATLRLQLPDGSLLLTERNGWPVEIACSVLRGPMAVGGIRDKSRGSISDQQLALHPTHVSGQGVAQYLMLQKWMLSRRRVRSSSGRKEIQNCRRSTGGVELLFMLAPNGYGRAKEAAMNALATVVLHHSQPIQRSSSSRIVMRAALADCTFPRSGGLLKVVPGGSKFPPRPSAFRSGAQCARQNQRPPAAAKSPGCPGYGRRTKAWLRKSDPLSACSAPGDRRQARGRRSLAPPSRPVLL